MGATILAIESSCDETSAAIVINGKLLNNVIATQSIHEIYGGVVPELASREHQKNIVAVVKKSLIDAGISLAELDAIAFTKGPGLLGSLLVGTSFAKGLALSLNIPLIGVNHMKAHIAAHFIDKPIPPYPFICLTISGGHTQIVKVKEGFQVEIIGETADDAIGEAFDKCAKLMGLSYPGGPEIDKLAKKGHAHAFTFPKTEMDGYNYSFSGIKTAFMYFLNREVQKDDGFVGKNLEDLCASLQNHLVEMVFEKLELAADDLAIRNIAIAGGVAANSGVRAKLMELSTRKKWQVFIPEFEYCTDNAGMIAMAACFMYENGEHDDLKVVPDARLKLR